MSSFRLDFFDKHPLIKAGEQTILVDTGAPSSLSVNGELRFGEFRHSCDVEIHGITVPGISELLGASITGLMGVDILSQYKVLIDYRGGSISFLRGDSSSEAGSASLTNFMGIPIVKLSIDGVERSMFLDSGATISYLQASLLRGYISSGVMDDFHPSYGPFKTDLYELETNIAGWEFKAVYGVLPAPLEEGILRRHAVGVIGYDFFSNFKVLLDLAGGRVSYTS